MNPTDSAVPQEGSGFKFYSFGLVANNKTQSSHVIQVTPIEALTMLDGELGSIPMELETEGEDASGQAYTSKVTTDTAIEADWMPGLGITNRRTPPDVRRGERVMICTYADDDKYYWMTLGLDDHLRKLETAVYSWSGTSDEAVDGTEDGNCYSLEVSTHTGQITLKTSKINGEHCMYAVQINAKEGKIMIVDDVDNEFVFDSKNTNLWMKNADGTLVELNKKSIKMFASDKIHIEATNSIYMKTNDFKIECQPYSLQCSTYTLKCNTGTVEGQMTFKSPVTFNAATTFTAPMTAAGITSSAPVKGPSDTLN